MFIEARRKIRAGEELTYDYRLSLDRRIGKKTRAAYACRCGSENCRGSLLIKPRKKRSAAQGAEGRAGPRSA